MATTSSIPVILPVFNRPEYTGVCLENLLGADPGHPIWPVIVDSGSRKRTQVVIDEYRQKRSGISACRLERNLGFAAAVNRGLSEVSKTWASEQIPDENLPPVVIMHNDTIPFAGWAAELRACLMGADEDASVAMPMTNYANEMGVCLKDVRERFEKIKPDNKMRILPEEIGQIVKETYPGGRGEILERLASEAPRFSYVPEVASFCMMFKGQLLSRYPWFDEDFVLRGYEDKFWFLPMERDGHIAMLARRAFVHHFGNITSDGPGYCFGDGMKINEQKFREKVQRLNEGSKAYNETVDVPGEHNPDREESAS